MAKSDCYACGKGRKCLHGVPLPRPTRSVWGKYKRKPACVGAKTIPSAVMSDYDARKVVFQPLGTLYYSAYPGGRSVPTAKGAARWPDGSLRIDTDGSGKLHNPEVESIEGDALARYLKLVPNPSQGALKGRDWKTGKLLTDAD